VDIDFISTLDYHRGVGEALHLAVSTARKFLTDILPSGNRRFSSQANEDRAERDGVGERERDSEAKGR
jgi:hypothetical protein